MAAWTTIVWPATSYFGSGLSVADMGPYIGPWPLLSPGVVDEASGETDFYLALPNPASPTDVHTVADGSYGTDIYDAYRYTTVAPISADGYFNDHVGPGSFSGAFVPGMHLYVVVFTTAPAHPPAYYVSPSYARGGTAKWMSASGHWTGWQPGVTVSSFFPVAPSRTGWDSSDSLDVRSLSAFSDVGSMFATALGDLLSTAVVGGAGDATFNANAGKTNGLLPLDYRTGVFCRLGQGGYSYHADTFNPDPRDALIAGVDYGSIPTGETSYIFESADPVAIAWAEFTLSADPSSAGSSGAAPSSFSSTASVSLLSAPLSPGDPVPVAGSVLATVGVSAGGGVTTVGFTPPASGPDLFLVVSPQSVFGVDGGATPDWGPFVGSYTWTFAAGVSGGDYSWTTSQFQYWTANPIVAAPPAGEVPLRLHQRNDGLGPSGHPRLRARNGATSVQLSAAPRLGASNSYS